jgi:drug/metabolite transporter (DMT)-like permease
MTEAALLLALGAAVLHAAWNLLLGREGDVHAATAVMFLVSVVLLVPVALFTWDVDADVWPWAVGSATFELAYFALLASAYERADVSVVYPVARGLAPVLVLVVGITAARLGEVAGVLLVAAGVALVRGLRSPERRGVAFGAIIALCIAGYTLLDDQGIEHADPFSYFLLVVGVPGVLYTTWVLRWRGRAAVRAALGWMTAAASVAATLAYLLVLAALERADAAPVAAVRETSVVFAVAGGAAFLGERVTTARVAGAALVATGVALLSW